MIDSHYAKSASYSNIPERNRVIIQQSRSKRMSQNRQTQSHLCLRKSAGYVVSSCRISRTDLESLRGVQNFVAHYLTIVETKVRAIARNANNGS
jgi:hypothetical protein